MMISNELAMYLNALGSKEGDKKIFALIENIGSNFERSEFKVPSVHRIYYEFFNAGVAFCFDKSGTLNAIIFCLVPTEEYHHSYCSLSNLITLNKQNKITILETLGEPYRMGKGGYNWLIYKIQGKFIHFEFDQSDVLTRVTLMDNLP